MKAQIVLLILCFETYVSANGFKCVNGVSYRQNDCNNCQCLDNNLVCSRLACNSPNSKKLSECLVGTQFTMNGKECNCVAEFGTVCVKE